MEVGSYHFKANMKLLIVATLIITTSSQQTPRIEKRCSGVYFSNQYYDIEVLKDGLNDVQQLILNRNDNTLYFIYGQAYGTGLGYLKVDTNEVGIIVGVRNATSIAIDQQYNKIYIGSQDGIYKINNYNRIPDRLPVYDSVQSMYFKDVLFFTNTRNEAFIFEDGQITPVFELQRTPAEKIILDDDHNIFFTVGKELFRVRLGTRIVNSHEMYKTDVLTTDSDHKPFIVTRNGTYTYNKYKYAFDKVADMKGLKGLTFNKFGDPFYAVVDLLIKLKPNPNRCYEPVVYKF
ncbi:hypothetical protein NE865_04473 [Phthorimaea operculella]|nr:hypothetical protein NE865_04473 [Phthorimaea operculella]